MTHAPANVAPGSSGNVEAVHFPLSRVDQQIVENARILQWCMNHSEQFITAPHECSSSFFVLAACTFFGQLPGLSKPNSFENKVSNMAIIIHHLQGVLEQDLSHIDPASVVTQEKEHVAELLRVFLEIVCPPQHKIHTWRSNVVPPHVTSLDEQFVHLEALLSDLEDSIARRMTGHSGLPSHARGWYRATAPTHALPTEDINAWKRTLQRCVQESKHPRSKAPSTPLLGEKDHGITMRGSTEPVNDAQLSRHTKVRLQRITQQEVHEWKKLLVHHRCRKELHDRRALHAYKQAQRNALAEWMQSACQSERDVLAKTQAEQKLLRETFDAAMREVDHLKRNLQKELRQREKERRVEFAAKKRELLSDYEQSYKSAMDAGRSMAEKYWALGGNRYID